MSTPTSTAIAPSRRTLLRPDECRAWTGASCFCAGILGVEAVDDLGELRDTFDAARPDYRDVIRAGLLYVVKNRPLSVDQWYRQTHVRFPDRQQPTAYPAQVRACLFDNFDAVPPAPQ